MKGSRGGWVRVRLTPILVWYDYTDSYTDWRDKIENDEGLIVLSDEIFDTEQDGYYPDDDSYKSPLYEQEDKIKYFEETTLRSEMEEWRFGQLNHPFKSVLR